MNRIRIRQVKTTVILKYLSGNIRLGLLQGLKDGYSVKVEKAFYELGKKVSVQYIRPLWIVPTRPRYPAYRAPYLEAYTREYRWLEMENRRG